MAEAALFGAGGGQAAGDTFLTDMLLTGNQASKISGVGAKKKGKAVFQTASKPNMRSGSQNRATTNEETAKED